MNCAVLRKYIRSLTLRPSKKQSGLFSTGTFYFESSSQKTPEGRNIDSDRNRSRPFSDKHVKFTKNLNKPAPTCESEVSKFISSNRVDPDCFGTLSRDWSLQQELSSMPDEEDDVVETEFLNNTEGKTRLSTNQYGKIIKEFINQKKIGHALAVLETRMREDRAKPENYIYNLLIGACGQVGYTRKAFNLFKQMRDKRLKVTGHTYTGLFNSCANSPLPEDALRRARHLRNLLLEKGVLMNQTIYHSMIKAFGRCGDLETAFILVDEMLEKKIMVSDTTFNFLLQACITDKEVGFRHALLVWQKMLEKRVRPNLFSFNLLLRSSRDCGLGDEATTQQVIQVLLHAGQRKQVAALSGPAEDKVEKQVAIACSSDVAPNLICRQPTLGSVVAVNSITSPEHRLMLMGGSKGVLEQMEMFGVKPDIKTFTQLLDQLPSTCAAEEELLRDIKKSEVVLDVDFCNMLIRKRCLRMDYDNAKEVLRIIQGNNLKPDIMTFGVLAMACQSLSSAQQLLKDIDTFGYYPNIEILGTLLKNGCYARDPDFVIDVMKQLGEEGLKPNEQFMKHLNNYHKFVTKALGDQTTKPLGPAKVEKLINFCKYYKKWLTVNQPEDLPRPWSQFKDVRMEPEDLALINRGRAKYAKL